MQDPRPRLFFAVPLPAAARDEVAALAEKVRAAAPEIRARWVRFEGLHLTLRFLGPSEPDVVPVLSAALDRVAEGEGPFDVVLRGGGAFPSIARPRTLWVAVAAGADRLSSLSAGITSDPAVAPLVPVVDADRAARPERYAPHLTIARTDGVPRGSILARALIAEAEALEVRFRVERVVLYRSHLGGGPARYEALHEVQLGG